jgi:hypothetical protein
MLGSRQEPLSPSWPHLCMMARRAEIDLWVTELGMAGMASADESAMPFMGLFPQCDGGAWLSRLGNSGADPFYDPMSCRSCSLSEGSVNSFGSF